MIDWSEGGRDSAIKKFFSRELIREEKIELTRRYKGEYGLNCVLKALRLSKGTWYYAQRKRSYVVVIYNGIDLERFFYPFVEWFMPKIKAECFAYNLIFLCRIIR